MIGSIRVLQAYVVIKVGRAPWRTVFLKITGTCHHAVSDRAESSSTQRRVGKLRDTDREIKALGNQIDVPVVKTHLEFQGRMLCSEMFQSWAKLGKTEAQRRGNLDASA